MPRFDWPDLVVFDLDNTLYDYSKSNEFATTNLLNSMGTIKGILPIDGHEVFGEARNRVKERLGSTASSHSRVLYISEMYRILGWTPNPQEFIFLEEVYWSSFLSKLQLFSGARETLDRLSDKGIHIALVTDLTSTIQYRKLVKLQINNYFNYIVTSEESGGDKVSGKPFSLLKETLIERPSKIWFFGDSESDRAVIPSVKGTFFQKTNEESASKEKSSVFFKDYSTIIEILKSK